jgi:hypothetical protein
MKAFLFKTQQTTGFIAFDLKAKYLGNWVTEQEALEKLAGYEIHREDHNVIVKGKLVHKRDDNYGMKVGQIDDIMLVPGIFDGTPYWVYPTKDGKDPGSGGFHTYRYEVLDEI